MTNRLLYCVGWGGGSFAAEEDPDHWERSWPDPGGLNAGQCQAWRERKGLPERKFITYWTILILS